VISHALNPYSHSSSPSASARMAAVRRRNTQPELALRLALREQGVSYRLHKRDLPGTPDIVIRRSRIAIFVHGCFWHRHKGCARATLPKSNRFFWSEKFVANVRRDARNARILRSMGWKVFVVWECGIETHAQRVARRIAASAKSRYGRRWIV
jgi:DNA mismatch endonuclease, patch repair protein